MKISTLFYTIRQGFANIFRNKWYSLASIATISACLFLSVIARSKVYPSLVIRYINHIRHFHPLGYHLPDLLDPLLRGNLRLRMLLAFIQLVMKKDSDGNAFLRLHHDALKIYYNGVEQPEQEKARGDGGEYIDED